MCEQSVLIEKSLFVCDMNVDNALFIRVDKNIV